MAKTEDLTGQKFGKLLVIRELPKEDRMGKKVTYECLCDCGNTTKVVAGYLSKGSKTNCGCMSTTAKKDLDGKRFGMLTVLHEVPKEERTQKNKVTWECLCDCGERIALTTYRLTSGKKTDCGCVYNLRLAGKKFGKLTAIRPLDDRKYKQVLWDCVCECGNHTNVRAYRLTAGKVKSCGCLISPDLTGNKYGMLTVISKTDERLYGKQVVWVCLCDCGNYKDVATNSLTQGNTKSCGCLWDSSGEMYIRDYLNSTNILHDTEYSFKDLHQEGETRLLRFDFAILDADNTVKLLIEYDGKQHFQPVEYYGGSEAFIGTVARDNLKNNYCIENNIPLIRIPYTRYNDIEEILDKALKDYIL